MFNSEITSSKSKAGRVLDNIDTEAGNLPESDQAKPWEMYKWLKH